MTRPLIGLRRREASPVIEAIEICLVRMLDKDKRIVVPE